MAEYDPNCIFCKIVRGETPGTIVHRDEQVTAFRDIAPAAPTHILIVPNEHIAQIAELSEAHAPLLGRLVTVANELARQEGIDRSGYRLIVNHGPDADQSVFHVHLHLVGGRRLGALVGRE